jgi:signal transduction histidine kinase
MKSRFFANISHEFRTPLTLILGPLEDVIAKVKDKDAGENLRIMARSANRLLRLINQLLDLSRLESGRMTLHARRGDFIGFLRGIVMSFASLAEQKKIALKFASELE